MKIAVVGASGAVGRKIIQELEASQSIDSDCELLFFASARSEGQKIPFRQKQGLVKAWSLDAIRGCDYILMSAGGSFSREYAQAIVADGGILIDNSSAWRMTDQIPLVVPEVNGSVLKGFTQGIIANPNCSTIQMLVSLKPLADNFGLEMVQVSTYQSVSGSGQKGIRELENQSSGNTGDYDAEVSLYSQPIGNNVIPAIGAIEQDGYCEEELKMIHETRKILDLPNLAVLATTVRVPAFHCHSESITVKLKKPVCREEVVESFQSMDGLVYSQDDKIADIPSPYHCAGRREVFVGRLRLLHGQTKSNWLQYWNVADNLLKGAATNAVQILEKLISS